MKILALHCDYVRYKAKKKALKADWLEKPSTEETEITEPLVVFISAEKEDEGKKGLEEALIQEILDIKKQVKAEKIVLYPYAHLSTELSVPKFAAQSLNKAYDILKEKGEEVYKSPFGYYKSFELKCKGHPLSELSRKITVEKKQKERKEESEFSRWVLFDKEGKEFEITPKNFADSEIFKNKDEAYKRLKIFVRNELVGKKDSGKVPKHIAYMKNQELVDYCEVSEKGHHKWYPKGVLLRRLLLEYARNLSLDWGAFEMTNPILIKGDNNKVGELMGEFHEREYKVDGGRGIGFLRYASDPLGFPFMQQVQFSYTQSPLKVYEEASCFRNEQEGEVSGLKRLRNFLMTDMHAACATAKEAKPEFEELCIKFGELMNDIIASGKWVLGWEGTIEFFEENKEWLKKIGVKLGVPSFFKLSKEMNHYYAIKNEYQTILEDESNLQISTVQWDVKDGPRFDIGFINEQGVKEPCEVIIHASSFGSIERTLCSILENIAIDEKKGKVPQFSYWLSPSQLRVLPVSDSHNEFGEKLAKKLLKHNVRAEVDDRGESIGKKIVNSEKEWVSYTIVVGDKEIQNSEYQLRSRGGKENITLTEKQLIEFLKEKQGDMPWQKLSLPIKISQRPRFS